jgi:hypothetical protein
MLKASEVYVKRIARLFQLLSRRRAMSRRPDGALRSEPLKYQGEPLMDHAEEKRRNDRFACGTPVEWGYFNKSEKHSAKMLNFSHEGICFECSRAPVNGATIMVRLETYQSECRSDCKDEWNCPWPRSIVLGDVKWCHDITSSGLTRFGVGVKFHSEP